MLFPLKYLLQRAKQNAFKQSQTDVHRGECDLSLSSKEVGQYLVIRAKRSPNLKNFFEERIVSH